MNLEKYLNNKCNYRFLPNKTTYTDWIEAGRQIIASGEQTIIYLDGANANKEGQQGILITNIGVYFLNLVVRYRGIVTEPRTWVWGLKLKINGTYTEPYWESTPRSYRDGNGISAIQINISDNDLKSLNHTIWSNCIEGNLIEIVPVARQEV